MAVLKKLLYIAGKTFYIGTIVVTAIIILACLSIYIVIPVANNIVAPNLANDIKKLPLPENTEITASISIARKLTGNGNGMQYFGAILIKSELSLEQLQAHYAHYSVEPQTEEYISHFHNGQYKFNFLKEPALPLINHYIVYAWGDANAFLVEFDIRGR